MNPHREASRTHYRGACRRMAEIRRELEAANGLTNRIFVAGAWTCPACNATSPAEGLCDCIARTRARS